MKNEKYVDYMWLLRVSGSILLLLSIFSPFADKLFLVPFLCISVDLVLWYYDKYVAIAIISIIAALVMVAWFAREGLAWIAALGFVVGMNSLVGFLYGGFTIFAIICIPVVYVLCCCNKRIVATITSVMTVLAVLVSRLVFMFDGGELLRDVDIRTNSLTGFLYGSFIEICILAVFILCCYNKRTVATVICIAVALASIPALAYMELDDMSISIFYNAYNIYVFLGGVVAIVWSWIMDSDFPVPVGSAQ